MLLERSESLVLEAKKELERSESLVSDAEREKAEVKSRMEEDLKSVEKLITDLEGRLEDVMSTNDKAAATYVEERDEARAALSEKQVLLERSNSLVEDIATEKETLVQELWAERERAKQLIAVLENKLKDAATAAGAATSVAEERDEARATAAEKEALLERSESLVADAEKEMAELAGELEAERELAKRHILDFEKKLADAAAPLANATITQNGGKPNGFGASGRAEGESDVDRTVALQSSLDDALERISALQCGEEEHAEQLLKANEELGKQRAQTSSLESSLDAANERVEELDTRVERSDRETAIALKSALEEAARRCTGLEATVEDLKSSSVVIADSLEAERLAAVTIRADLDSALRRASSLENELAEKSSECAAACASLEKAVASAGTARESLSVLQSELEVARSRLAHLEGELAARRSESTTPCDSEKTGSAPENAEKDQLEVVEDSSAAAELKASIARILELESELAATRSEKLPEVGADSSSVPPEGETELADQLKESVADVAKLRSLESEARKALTGAKSQLVVLEASNKELLEELRITKTALADADASVAAQVERSSNVESISKAAESATAGGGRYSLSSNQSSGGSEDVNVLQAKVAELERLLSAKQAEMVKVREKARSYLKDMNAEKREMETKLKAELAESVRKLEAEKERFGEAERDSEGIAQEVDSCLRVISEKQKAIQALNMTISNERAATNEAQAQLTSLNSEFNEYKERAWLALAERDASLATASTGVESATDELSSRMEQAEAEAAELRNLLQAAKAESGNLGQLEERAVRAEEALDAVKVDASVLSSSNFSRIDTLEDELETVRKELAAAESAFENTEARLATTVVRLEVAERALKSAELAAEEASRTAGNVVLQLRGQIRVLQESVGHANESAAAAQRTAAVAARAMAYTHLEDEAPAASSSPAVGAVRESPSFQSERASVSSYASGNVHLSLPEPFSPAATSGSGRREGASATLRGFLTENPVVGEVSARDDQIAVLMSQISELGVLLEDSREESTLREQQVELLKAEVGELAKKLAAADKLKGGTPFGLLRTTVVHFMRTGDAALLPVLGTVLGVSEDEMKNVHAARAASSASTASAVATGAAGYLPSFMSSAR